MMSVYIFIHALVVDAAFVAMSVAFEDIVPDRMTFVEEEMIKIRYDVNRLLDVHNMLPEDETQGTANKPVYGNCRIMPNIALGMRYYEPITGLIDLRQNTSTSDLEIKSYLYGFQNYYSRHGFHVHELGDMTHGCNSMSGHYNPFGKAHGAHYNNERHVGDWGNIDVSGSGTIEINMKDSLAKLTGPNSIVGRGIVIHMGRDDLGVEDDVGSRTSGNAGMRLACCVIGISNGDGWN